MCVAPLSLEKLENMKKFQYKTTDESLLYNKCMSPCLNKVVNILPYKLAPNLITLFSLCCNIIAAIYTYNDVGFDFEKELKHKTCIIIGITQFLYQILDNLDGKQARRTGTSSPFGMLLDHGCDIFTNLLSGFNMTHILLLGNNNFWSFSCFFGLILGFYSMTYEEYKLGEMFFPIINATDEGNIMFSSLCVLLGIFGQNILKRNLYKNYLTVGQAGGLFVTCGGISCVYNLFLHTYKKRGIRQFPNIIFDWIYFYIVLIFPIFYIYKDNLFYVQNKWIIILVSGFLFARETIDLQIKIVTMDKVKVNFFVFLMNILIIFSFFIEREKYKIFFLYVICTMEISELIMFIILRANEITNFLGIKILTINPRMEINVI